MDFDVSFPRDSSLLRWTGITAAGVLLVLNFLYADLAYRQQQVHSRPVQPTTVESRLPSPTAFRLAFLDFRPFAADLVWVWALIHHGEYGSDERAATFLEDVATTIADLNPYFLPVYEWFSTTYINRAYPPSHEDLERVNDFLDRGIEHFPTHYRLPYTAGMNYIGYSMDRPPEQRLEEVEHAIDYLERASQLEGAPKTLPLTVSWLYHRKQQLERQLSDEETDGAGLSLSDRQIHFLTNMYFLVESETTRQRIARTLRRAGVDQETLLKRGRRFARRLRTRHRNSHPYVPLDLWTTLIEPSR